MSNGKNELVQHYRWLRQFGLNDSHSGNASVREADHFWVTPTGACADTLTENDLVKVSLQGDIPKDASLDAALHRAVYTRNDTAQCVLHSHGPYSITMTMDGKDFTPIDFEGQYYFSHIPVLNIAFDDYLEQSPHQVARSLATNKVCVVRGHGVYAQAPGINLAYKWTTTFEHVAHIAYLSQQRNAH
jgi:L-fuculose-phosphate aldolase